MADKKDHKPGFTEPMTMQMLHPKQCKDCAFRNRTTVNIDGKEIEVGSTKSDCIVYPYPEMKPWAVMENREECDYYEKE